MFYIWDPVGKVKQFDWEAVSSIAPVEAIRDQTKSEKVPPTHKITEEQGPKSIPIKRFYERLKRSRGEAQQALTAAQIMTFPVVTLTPENTLYEAWQLFAAKRFRHIPVLSKEGKLVGILSDRDMLRHAIDFNDPLSRQESHVALVKDLMRSPVISAVPNAEIRQIAFLLFKGRIGCIPIVDRQGILVGILTRSDILRCIIHHTSIELWI